MGIKQILFKQILLLAIVFYFLPGFWWAYNDMDQRIDRFGDVIDDGDSPNPGEYFLSVKFLMSTGSLMTIMGMTYVALPIDLLPDFIPIFGGMDDNIAKLTAGGGMMMTYMGYKFGTGETPPEFEMAVSVARTIYNTIMPIIKEQVIPVVLPGIKAMLVPIKVAARSILGLVLETVRDPKVQESVKESVVQMMGENAAAAGAAAAAAGGADL